MGECGGLLRLENRGWKGGEVECRRPKLEFGTKVSDQHGFVNAANKL